MELKDIKNTDLRLNERYEILTPDGFKPFYGMRKVLKKEWVEVTFVDGKKIGASGKHTVELESGRYCEVRNLGEGARLKGPGNRVIAKIEFRKDPVWMYDIVDTPSHLYCTDGFISHNCDFLASGDTIFDFADLDFFDKTTMMDPVERRGVDGNFWIWERPDYTRSYLLSADVARGDGTDYSAFHIWDVETCAQVAEYKGKIMPKDFGAFLVAAATEYNNALLVCENANIGWATIEEILSRGYQNLYYSTSGNVVLETADSYMSKMDKGKLVPGFTTSTRTRPLVVAKIIDYVHQHECILRSKRLLTEMRTFIWKNGKAEAQEGMNDDVVMSAAIGLYVRDTALQLRQQGLELSRAQLTTFGDLNKRKPAIIQPQYFQNPYEMQNRFGQKEDISWVLS